MDFPDTASTGSLYTDAASGQLWERRYQFRVVAGPDAGMLVGLDTGTTLVGTHENNDIVLTDDTVSRYHLELRQLQRGVKVIDLDSTNGTRQGKTRVGTITISGATKLRLGKRTRIEIVPEAEEVTLNEYVSDRFAGVIGTSDVMRNLFALLNRVAPSDATVMLQGETGTGKEAIAEAIHAGSMRANQAFVVVDCGAIPHNLIGSELFGHMRGAYTGANQDKQGLIETAHAGTLFLDEIGELALDLQPQLLRVLEKGEVRRVGATQSTKVDLRIIVATHRDLLAMVKAGQFREDLYYRLAVVKAVIPPLRDRIEDLPALVDHFAQDFGRGTMEVSQELFSELAGHHWPGNVRELRNVVQRALSLGSTGLADRQTPAPVVAPTVADEESFDLPFKQAKAQLVESFEREYLKRLLDRNNGNISRAASEAGIDRNYVHRLVKKYGLSVDRK